MTIQSLRMAGPEWRQRAVAAAARAIKGILRVVTMASGVVTSIAGPAVIVAFKYLGLRTSSGNIWEDYPAGLEGFFLSPILVPVFLVVHVVKVLVSAIFLSIPMAALHAVAFRKLPWWPRAMQGVGGISIVGWLISLIADEMQKRQELQHAVQAVEDGHPRSRS